MYDSGVVAGQNGEIWSRGLPASWVMVVFATSTVAARSAMTRYGDIGTASERRRMSQSASHSARMLAIRAATVAARSVRGSRIRSPTASRSAGQGQPGVADQPDLHRHDLVEVRRVERGVDVALGLPATAGRSPSS